MSDLIDKLNTVVRVLIEDGYPAEYADSVANAIYMLERQAERIKELEDSLFQKDFEMLL